VEAPKEVETVVQVAEEVIKPTEVKKESTDTKVKSNLAPAKKKNTVGKNDKVENFKNKELHLKEPKPKKNHNKKDLSHRHSSLENKVFLFLIMVNSVLPPPTST
jgi:hypothetical protein